MYVCVRSCSYIPMSKRTASARMPNETIATHSARVRLPFASTWVTDSELSDLVFDQDVNCKQFVRMYLKK